MPDVLASIINLGGNGRYVHWGWVQISVANLVVIGFLVTRQARERRLPAILPA